MTRPWITVTAIPLLLAATAPVPASEELARKSGCFECHGMSENKRGPAFEAIAQRYRDQPGADESLFGVIRNGGKGNWSDVSHGAPMPPYSRRLSDDEIKQLVDWILDL